MPRSDRPARCSIVGEMPELLKALAEAAPGWLGSLIVALIGFLGGVVGAIATPWANWSVEKRRTRQDERRKLIQEAREAIDNDRGSNLPDFVDTATYSAIKPYLRDKIIKAMEHTDIIGAVGNPRRNPGHRTLMLDELARLEKEWKLI